MNTIRVTDARSAVLHGQRHWTQKMSLRFRGGEVIKLKTKITFKEQKLGTTGTTTLNSACGVVK